MPAHQTLATATLLLIFLSGCVPVQPTNPFQSSSASSSGNLLGIVTKGSKEIREAVLATIPAGRRVNDYEVVFSQTGKAVAYLSKDSAEKSRVTFGNVDGPLYAKVALPVFSADNKSILYGARESAGNWFVVEGNTATRTLTGSIGSPVFSPDRKHVAYRAFRNGRVTVIVDDREGNLFDDVLGDTITFTSDSAHVFYQVKNTKEKKSAIALDGKAGEMFDEVRHFSLSPDATKFAYVGLQGQQWYSLKFSMDGTAITRRAIPSPTAMEFIQPFTSTSPREAKLTSRYQSNFPSPCGLQSPSGDPPVPFGFQSSITTPDGQHVALIVANGLNRFFVVVDGKNMSKCYDAVWQPQLSPNGQTVGYGAREKAKLLWVENHVKE